MSITLIRGDDQVLSCTVYTTPSKTTAMNLINVDEIWFSIKKVNRRADLDDTNVLLQKTMSGGSIVIIDEPNGLIEVTITKDDLVFAKPRARYTFDIQIKFAGDLIRTAIIDTCIFEYDVTRTNI